MGERGRSHHQEIRNINVNQQTIFGRNDLGMQHSPNGDHTSNEHRTKRQPQIRCGHLGRERRGNGKSERERGRREGGGEWQEWNGEGEELIMYNRSRSRRSGRGSNGTYKLSDRLKDKWPAERKLSPEKQQTDFSRSHIQIMDNSSSHHTGLRVMHRTPSRSRT